MDNISKQDLKEFIGVSVETLKCISDENKYSNIICYYYNGYITCLKELNKTFDLKLDIDSLEFKKRL